MKGNKYWEREEIKVCRICGGGEENWKHVWEECMGWRSEGSWQEMKFLGEEGEGKSWLKELERIRDEGVREKGLGERGGRATT